MTRTYTEAEVVEMLKAEQGERSLREFAEALGISPSYLSDIYLGKRAPGPAVLDQMELEKVEPETKYRKRQSSAAD